ncbi:hypothetical protein M422DRAFT_779193 [Sphaerobolus stellatus SS14]|uniref:Acetyl-CoA C-acyltransferase n=1 Tax=Sphaerobolus stellatus (strain SS14) TaxID=990650 RepID=A0A0C9UQW2_SPHS4|nr:hypothetical protein M422DRAFT_779193 [Sphaerobolus stellatus SS14]
MSSVVRVKIDPATIDDTSVGVCHPPSPLYLSRAAALSAGILDHVPIHTINRLCSSGLVAIRSIAQLIKAGDATLGLALGVESMSLNPRPSPEHRPSVEEIQKHMNVFSPWAEPLKWSPKPTTSKQDSYALFSHTPAAHALQSGIFADEIIAVEIAGQIHDIDDPIRLGTTKEGLEKLKPVFPQWGTASTTAGNTSGVGDGAAIAVITTRERAEREGWEVQARWAGCAVVGVGHCYMGISPIVAIPKILEKLGLTKEDIDLWEINEAFASQFAYCVETLDVPMDKSTRMAAQSLLRTP